jgi:cell division septal protein FtsQ
MTVKSYWPQKQAHARSANRDFGRRRFGNPLFRPPASKGASWQQRQRHRRSWSFITWRGVVSLAIVAAVAYGLWYLLWSETFRVKASAVRVEGASPEVELVIRGLIDQRLQHRDLFIFPQNNLLLLSGAGLKGDIATKVRLARLDVKKKLPTGLLVEVTENEPKVVTAAGGKLFVADASGMIIRELTEGERIKLGELPPALQSLADRGADIMVVSTKDLMADEVATTAGSAAGQEKPAAVAVSVPHLPWPLVIREDDQRQGLPQKTYAVGEAVLPPEAVKTVLDIEAELLPTCGTKAKWYTSRPSGETVEAMTTEGWSAQLSTAMPVKGQLNYLRVMLNKVVGSRRPDLLFIDVRYGEKIFTKFKNKAVPAAPKAKSPAH